MWNADRSAALGIIHLMAFIPQVDPIMKGCLFIIWYDKPKQILSTFQVYRSPHPVSNTLAASRHADWRLWSSGFQERNRHCWQQDEVTKLVAGQYIITPRPSQPSEQACLSHSSTRERQISFPLTQRFGFVEYHAVGEISDQDVESICNTKFVFSFLYPSSPGWSAVEWRWVGGAFSTSTFASCSISIEAHDHQSYLLLHSPSPAIAHRLSEINDISMEYGASLYFCYTYLISLTFAIRGKIKYE